MPAPTIKCPPGVKVDRDHNITYTRPASAYKARRHFGLVGSPDPLTASLYETMA